MGNPQHEDITFNVGVLFMSKLLKLKEWLTLDEAIIHLSKIIDEPVIIADLYRFALDGALTLSVNFVNGAFGLKGKWLKDSDIANKSELQIALCSSGKGFSLKSPNSNEMFVSSDRWISWNDDIEPIIGVYDLTMKGDESLDVKAHYHNLTSRINVKRSYNYGVLLQQDGEVFQLYKHFKSDEYNVGDLYDQIFPPQKIVISDTFEVVKRKVCCPSNVEGLDFTHYKFFNKIIKNIIDMYFVPSSSLAEQDVEFVIRTKELTRFIQSLDEKPQADKPLATVERNSLLILIRALLAEQRISASDRGIASAIKLMIEKTGMAMSENTIRKILNQVTDLTD